MGNEKFLTRYQNFKSNDERRTILQKYLTNLGIDLVEGRSQQEILIRVYGLFVFEIQQVLKFDLDVVKGKENEEIMIQRYVNESLNHYFEFIMMV